MKYLTSLSSCSSLLTLILCAPCASQEQVIQVETPTPNGQPIIVTTTAESLFEQAMRESQEGLNLSSIQSLTKACELEPANKKYALFLIDGLAKHSARLTEQTASMQKQAAEVARGVLKNQTELNESEREFLGQALYEEAKSIANTEDRTKAATLTALEEAFKSGFSAYEQIEHEHSFDWLRNDKEFQTRVAQHKQEFIKGLKTSLETAMKETESFPFDFNLKSAEGEPVALGDFKTKVLIVDLWATWCAPCREEIPYFVEMKKMLGKQGLEIIGINYEQTESDEEAIARITKFRETTELNYSLLIGDDMTKQQIPKFEVFPTTLFIDRQGDVRLVLSGPKSFLKMKTAAEMLLAEEK